MKALKVTIDLLQPFTSFNCEDVIYLDVEVTEHADDGCTFTHGECVEYTPKAIEKTLDMMLAGVRERNPNRELAIKINQEKGIQR